MLTCLRVRNFAIIDELEVEFGAGLNVVTGETGAGKSILVDALGLVLGEKGRAELVRTGAPQAEVEALFDVSGDPRLRARLEGLGVTLEGDELVIRRVVTSQGRARAYVNGSLATQAQITELAAGLADISSQHEHHTLADARTHLEYLDAFGGQLAARAALGQSVSELERTQRAIDDAEAKLRGRAEREDVLRFQLKEIDELAPQTGELAELAVERDRRKHAEKILRAARETEDAVYEQDGSVVEGLGRAKAALEDASRFEPRLAGAAEGIGRALAELEDVARSLSTIKRSVEVDPARLEEVEERLHQLQRLAKKYARGEAGGEPEAAILAHRERAANELATLESAEGDIEALEKAKQRALAEAKTKALAIHRARVEAAAKLEARITAELASLGMGGARIVVAVTPLEGKGSFAVDGAKLTPHGIDRVEFLIAPNAGEEPRPLGRIASGGELSRALLAMKRVLAEMRSAADGPSGLYVFDEVDTGVGGAIAEVIGRKMKEVSSHHQVLCITHLAPIAVFADRHLVVKKAVVDGRTKSDIVPLDERAKVEEIARMLGGLTITQKTRDAAAEMLRHAHV